MCHDPNSNSCICVYIRNYNADMRMARRIFPVKQGDFEKKAKGNKRKLRAQRLINLEIPVLVRSLKSSNVELG